MEVAIAEAGLGDADALEVKADVELVGDAHAAVHLHRLAADAVGGVAGLPLGEAGHARARRGVERRVVHRRQSGHHRAACELQVRIAPRGAVLQGLEAADRHVELHARLQVLDGGVEQALRRAEQLGRQAHPATIERGVERGEALALRAQQRRGADVHVVQHQLGVVARIQRLHRRHLHARRIRGDDEQADAALLAWLAAGARSDDVGIRAHTVGDKGLGAGEQVAIALTRGAQRDRGRVVARRFIHRQRDALVAADQRCHPLRLLRCGAGELDHRAAEHDARQQRRGRQVAADLLEHRAQALAAELKATERFREGNRAPAHVDHLAPQRGIEALGRTLVAQLALGGDRALRHQELGGGVGQQLLLFGINQTHDTLLLTCPACPRWRGCPRATPARAWRSRSTAPRTSRRRWSAQSCPARPW